MAEFAKPLGRAPSQRSSRKRPRDEPDPDPFGAENFSGENNKPNNGIITKIELQDFMNHANLTINPEPGLNMIGGHNGAGKSAILQALVLALGKNTDTAEI